VRHVLVDVTGGHEEAGGQGRAEGEEVAQHGAGVAVEGPDVGGAAGAGRGDDVGHAVAVDIANRYAHAASEAWVVGQEIELEGHRRAVVDLDFGRTAGIGTDGEYHCGIDR